MQKQVILKLRPSESVDEEIVKKSIAASEGLDVSAVTGYQITKRSLDARGKQQWIHLTLTAFIGEPFYERTLKEIVLKDVSNSKHQSIVVGAGPAGLFAALKLIEQGIKPIVLERGKDVKARRRDLAALNKNGIVNPESNYCFGEGGAGTYSDGKLYTRSSKRGDVDRILNILVQFGAQEQILYEAHPHIGTNKLPQIITAIRETIIACGGNILFETKVTDLIIEGDTIVGVKSREDVYLAESVILATGHSARDIFCLLHSKGILIEAKPFALGVRVEHPQSIIDTIQYKCQVREDALPPASYNLVHQVDGQGVFSFCMCPGGIIAPAATNPGELVVNGWSPSKRNNPYANSGMVVTVSQENLLEVKGFKKYLQERNADYQSPLAMMYFQEMVEKNAFVIGGGQFVAPAQRMVDYCTNINSTTLPDCSYVPGLSSQDLGEVLPSFIHTRLQRGFKSFGDKMRGYYTNEAVVVATESRTSSPVRIPRDADTLQHSQIKNLYPCAEGAGYAGGIVSAAMDGERIATMIASKIQDNLPAITS